MNMKLFAPKRAVNVKVCLKQLTARLDQMQTQLEGPLNDLLSRKQFPFNKRIKLHIAGDDVLHVIESLLLEYELNQEKELSTSEEAEFFAYIPQRRDIELEIHI